LATPDPNTPTKTTQKPPRRTRHAKMKDLFQPDENGVSRWVSIEELAPAGLKWDGNGNGRYGIYFGLSGYVWETVRLNNEPRGKILKLRTSGMRTTPAVQVRIDADIKKHFSQSTHCNISTLPIRKGKLEIDHRYGHYEHPTYRELYASGAQRVEDFQAVDAQQNLIKRAMCDTCIDTGIRPAHPELGFVEGGEGHTEHHPCRGCYLAEPERYRAVNVTVRSAGEVCN
jgi:hypothetical protein